MGDNAPYLYCSRLGLMLGRKSSPTTIPTHALERKYYKEYKLKYVIIFLAKG
jgi:hypothetical protein